MAGLSIRELAEAAGVDQSTLWRFEAERGSVRLPTLRKLAVALDVPVAALLSFADEDVA